MKLLRAFSSLYLATFFMLFGSALLATYLALDLAEKNVSALLISSLTTAYYAGLVIGAKLGHKLIAQVGHIRSYVAASGITAATVLLIILIDNVIVWTIIRFIIGLAMMCQYMVIESWLNDKAEPNQRGVVFALYMIATYFGAMLGQLTFLFFPTVDSRILLIVSICFSLCLVPLALTRAINPLPLKAAPLEIMYFIKKMTRPLIITAIAGMMVGSFYGLAPLFASRIGLNAHDAGIFMAGCIAAALFLQFPLGWLSDRFDRSRLIILIAILLIITSVMTQFSTFSVKTILVVSVISAGLQFTFYPLTVAIANNNVDNEKRVSLSAILLVVFGAGAAVGPIISSFFIQYFGATGLYTFVSICGLLIILTSFFSSMKPAGIKIH